jgi:hypothetical protein
MSIGKALVAAAVLALAAPATTAFAHDDDNYNQHQRDHRAHYGFHRDVKGAHQRAHEQGFDSRWEHRAYHRALRDLHGEFHEDHPGTRHDHYTSQRYRYGNQYGYRNQYRYTNRYRYTNQYRYTSQYGN